jgi:hypothetical protein
MQTSGVTMGELVDRTLFELEAPSEQGATVVLGAALSDTATTLTFSSGSAMASDLIEFGSELLQVVSVTDDPVPVYTVSRAFYRTTPVAHADGAAGSLNPQFPRRRCAEAVRRAFPRLEALGVPMVRVSTLQRVEGMRMLMIPSDAREVLAVLYVSTLSGDVEPIDGWMMHANMPTAKVPSGKALSLPRYVSDVDELEVVYRGSYSWTGTPPDEAASILVPSVAVDLPAQFAAAWLVTGREVSRQQIDRAEEQSQTDPVRVQSGSALSRLKWQEFYRSLDEVQRVTAFEIPKHRPFITMPRVRRALGRY